jgi:hypothetical protein
MTTNTSDVAPTHLRHAARAIGLAMALLLLSACEGDAEPGALTREQSDEALQMRHDYEAALAKRDFAGAAKIADRLRKKYPDSEAMASVRRSLDDTIARAQAEADSNRLATLWEYQKVPAGAGTQYTAQIASHVEIDENGLPAGPADARLVLRVHPGWGKSTYLLLTQSQFTCGDPCTMEIAFDEDTPESYVGEQADSGNGPALFIEERGRFYAAMQNAQVVKITLPKTGGVTPPKLRFEVGGYDATRLGTEF